MISGILHSHLFGQKIRLRHIRNGKELPTILEDNHYDFNFQASRFVYFPNTLTSIHLKQMYL